MNKLSLLPVIECRGFTLRSFRCGDEVSLEKYVNDRRVATEVSNIPFPYTSEHAKQWVHYVKNEMGQWGERPPLRVDFAIDVRGEVVGSVAFININGHKGQISYWLAVPYRGKGIMKKAVRALIAFGFEMGLVRIDAYVRPANEASRKVLIGAGFVWSGTHRKEWYRNGAYHDSDYYAIVNEDA